MNVKRLYAPWRSTYATDISKTKDENASSDACVFCKQLSAFDDEKYWILKRYTHHIVMLNKYPYNAGHLLILPLAHVATLDTLSVDARAELMEITNYAVTVLKATLQPHGFNIGINLGKAAGAGIPSHLHMHVLPRFNGDTNFLTTIAETKQISFDLNDIFAQLKKRF